MAPVVEADAPRPVRLPREHRRRRVTCGRKLDPAAIEQVVQLSAELGQLPGNEALGGPGPRHRPGAGTSSIPRSGGRPGGKGRVILPLQGDRGVDEAKRREVELRSEERGPSSKWGVEERARDRRGAEPRVAGVGSAAASSNAPRGPAVSTCPIAAKWAQRRPAEAPVAWVGAAGTARRIRRRSSPWLISTAARC